MVGIVLASHGKLAEGMYDAAVMLFGEMEQAAVVSLEPGESSDAFLEKLRAAIGSVDTGDGVIVLCDIMGGTSCNKAAFLLDKAQVLTGMNLPLVLELLGQRLDDSTDIDQLVSIGRSGVIHLNPMFQNL